MEKRRVSWHFIYIYISFESVKTTKVFFLSFLQRFIRYLSHVSPEDPCFNLCPTFTVNINHACREIHHPKIDPSWVNLRLGCVGCLGYIGDSTTQLYGDLSINHKIRIPFLNHQGFNGQ